MRRLIQHAMAAAVLWARPVLTAARILALMPHPFTAGLPLGLIAAA